MNSNEEENKKAKKFQIKYFLIPVCIVIITFIGYNIYNKKKNKWIVEEIKMNGINDEVSSGLAIISKWEKRTINNQYSTIKYDNNNYYTCNTTTQDDKIKEKLGEVVASGYDEYTKNTYTKNAEIYEIKGLARQACIAIKFEEDSTYYVYINLYYKPETLGQFIEDLQLKEIATFEKVYYKDPQEHNEKNKYYNDVEFVNVDNNVIWEILFSDVYLENIYNDNYNDKYGNTIARISVKVPLIENTNVSISLTEEGYLTTNILRTGKTFYIGKEKVKEFVNYILKNYQGHQTVYVYEDKDEEQEENSDILMYDKETNTVTIVTPNSTKKESTQNYTLPYNPTVE